MTTMTFVDPRHADCESPCEWCGQPWKGDTLVHLETCDYIEWCEDDDGYDYAPPAQPLPMGTFSLPDPMLDQCQYCGAEAGIACAEFCVGIEPMRKQREADDVR